MQTMPPNADRVYWPQLDGLRFLAFMMVFFVHLGPLPDCRFGACPGDLRRAILSVQSWAWTGVELFFVLSGFLITLLICKEQLQFGTFSFTKFITRRALRIWPLYYLHLLLMFFLFPFFPGIFQYSFASETYGNLVADVPFLILFVKTYFDPPHPFPGFLWSIWAEEQFYFLWGLTMKIVRSTRMLLFLMFGLLGGTMAQRVAHVYFGIGPAEFMQYLRPIVPLVIGSLIGVLFSHGDDVVQWIRPHGLAIGGAGLVLVLTIFLTVRSHVHGALDPRCPRFAAVFPVPLLSLGYGAILVGVLTWTPAKHILANACMVSLGKRTYAMYMFHSWVNSLSASLFTSIVGDRESLGLYWCWCSCSLATTISVAYVSWFCFERYFIALRHMFSRVESGLDRADQPDRLQLNPSGKDQGFQLGTA